ncbi:MAG: PDZ domain-containing protein [Candidatus Omnitrophica bacterium]|nr:PDZ domain-containing protein [Candidatus Omnitrophota bacterium]
MKMTIVKFCLLLCFQSASLACLSSGSSALADTVYQNDGSEIKGIVVENYATHIILSTFEGEKRIDKALIKDILYDTIEQNLSKLGDYHQERGNFSKAYSYYKRAHDANPAFKEAREKFIFMRSTLLRNPEKKFKNDMERKKDLFMKSGRAYTPSEKTSAVSPRERLRSSIGITLHDSDYAPRIGSVDPLSPADKSGIREADIIYSIWGKMVGYLETDSVIDLLIGGPSSEISLVIKRAITISRRKGHGDMQADCGISFGMEEEGLVVQAVRPGSDAAVNGLTARDLIVAINEEPTRYMPVNTAVSKVKSFYMSDRLRLDILREVSLWRKDS